MPPQEIFPEMCVNFMVLYDVRYSVWGHDLDVSSGGLIYVSPLHFPEGI
jgi:hypothetical protein